MGGWGESKNSGTVGTTSQIEEAHRVMDTLHIDPGPLAERARKAGLELHQSRLSEESWKKKFEKRLKSIVDL